jgi:hypothetical protein
MHRLKSVVPKADIVHTILALIGCFAVLFGGCASETSSPIAPLIPTPKLFEFPSTIGTKFFYAYAYDSDFATSKGANIYHIKGFHVWEIVSRRTIADSTFSTLNVSCLDSVRFLRYSNPPIDSSWVENRHPVLVITTTRDSVNIPWSSTTRGASVDDYKNERFSRSMANLIDTIKINNWNDGTSVYYLSGRGLVSYHRQVWSMSIRYIDDLSLIKIE